MTILIYLTLFFFLSAQFMACSGGSNSGGASGDDSITLSAKSLHPGQFLTINNDGLVQNDDYTVMLKDGRGYDIAIHVRCIDKGLIRIQLPVYFANDKITSGEVSVSVSGMRGAGSLQLKDTIPIAYEAGEKPGDILRWWLNEAVLTYQEVLNNLDSLQVDTAELAEQLQNEIDRLLDAIDEFDTLGTMTLYLSDTESQSLDENSLMLVDQMLFLQAAGLMQAHDQIYANRGLYTRGVLEDLIRNPDVPPTAQEILENLRRFKDETIPNVLDQIDSGSDLLAAFVATAAALGAIAVGVKAGAAYALLYSGIAALSYAGVTGALSEGLTWFQSKLDSTLGNVSLPDYEFGEEWLEHAIEGAQSFAFNLGGGLSEGVGDLVNCVWTAWSAIKAEFGLICSTQDPQVIKSAASRGFQRVEVDAEVCALQEDVPISAIAIDSPAELAIDQIGVFSITVSGGEPPFKIDLDWDDETTSIIISNARTATIKHGYDAEGEYVVGAQLVDIMGHTATAEATVSVGGTPGETSVTFQDMWDFYTLTLTFPDGQADGYTIVVDTDVYNTHELVEIQLTSYPADPNMWPQSTVPVHIEVSGNAFDDWMLYRNNSKSDWTQRVLLTHMTDETQHIGSKYYFVAVYPDSGPYRTIAFRLVGTGS